MRSTIALLTDFGVTDIYVGVMKGVMRRIYPDIDFIDLTHAIAPQSVREAALALLSAYRYFPPQTIFLVVVDPGVGSTRRPLAVQTDDYTFVAPDNGVLSYVLSEAGHHVAVELCRDEFHLKPTSLTFHGRDIFAPAAAHLASGVAFDQLGPRADDLKTLPLPLLEIGGTALTGEVVHIDHFGNIVTSIGSLHWDDTAILRLHAQFQIEAREKQFEADKLKIVFDGHQVQGVNLSYSAVAPGEVLTLVGSSGFLELAINQGSAAKYLKARVGDRVEVQVS